MAARIAELAPAGADALLAWNPEFLREGFAVQDTLKPDRIVIGVEDGRAEKQLRDFYAPMIDARLATRRHRLRDRRAGEGRGERLLGHEDLVHQRHGRGV